MPTRSAKLTAVAVAIAMTVAACATAEEDLGAGPDATSPAPGTETVTETVTETATETVAPTTSPTDTEGAREDLLRDLIVAPQEPRRVEAGATGEFTVPGRLGGEDLPGLLGFGWTPCEEVDATESGPLTFVDEDADGHADDRTPDETYGVAEVSWTK